MILKSSGYVLGLTVCVTATAQSANTAEEFKPATFGVTGPLILLLFQRMFRLSILLKWPVLQPKSERLEARA
jgi:hypothetical protein